jgi:serine/threonine protein kinase
MPPEIFGTEATLFGLLHAIPAPDWLRRRHRGGGAIVHMDLHPDNVMLTSRGPVVIDWSNAGVGDAEAEVADLWLILTCARAPGSAFSRAVVGVGRSLFARSFLRQFDGSAIASKLSLALELRSHVRNMSPPELERMRKFVERYGSSRSPR